MTLDKSLRSGSETIQAEEEASIRRKGENCGDPEDFAVHNCSNTAIIAVLSNDASSGDFHAIDDETEPETDAAAAVDAQQLQDRPIVISLQASIEHYKEIRAEEEEREVAQLEMTGDMRGFLGQRRGGSRGNRYSQ